MRIKSVEVLVAIIACAGVVISALYSYTNRNRELDIELIKIGIGILRADPKETQTVGARAWAIEIIEKYSGLQFSQQAKTELLKDRLDVWGGTTWGSDPWGSTTWGSQPLKKK